MAEAECWEKMLPLKLVNISFHYYESVSQNVAKEITDGSGLFEVVRIVYKKICQSIGFGNQQSIPCEHSSQ